VSLFPQDKKKGVQGPTWRDAVMGNVEFPGHLPPDFCHLRPLFEFLHLRQGGLVVLHALHEATAVLEEAHELIVHLVLIPHLWKEENNGTVSDSG